ncbi:VWA domain-containing protein [Puniceicoccaceae bacterium K14]|nr:VWA domain-containing protein [Puniceicoccaceae bacterium K14]
MKHISHLVKALSPTLATLIGLYSSPFSLSQVNDEEDEVFELSPFRLNSGFGATPGGAQDLNYVRSQVEIGSIPHPNTITAEGLFSEHDLPLQSSPNCETPICIFGEAMPAKLLQRPNTVAIGQIGFASGFDPNTWKPAPLNLIAIVDKSGSMSGQPLQLVKDSLLQVINQMNENDQLSVVLYGDRSYVHLPPTIVSKTNEAMIKEQIRAIFSSGSTNMENGLKIGYELAQKSAPSFEGNTRLMLFTDERPNVGNTSPEGFMEQMEAGSQKGFGLTTIGVGVQFGAELASTISSVRGGNLFYFPDYQTMKEKFENEFSTMVTELAYDMELVIHPSSGYNISGVYGVPSEYFSWGDDRSIHLKVETLFLSLRQGALYFALESSNNDDLPPRPLKKDSRVAQVSLSYQTPFDNIHTTQDFDFNLSKRNQSSIGMLRGENLINEYISLKDATKEHYENNDQESAYKIVKQLSTHLSNAKDPSLATEIEFVKTLEKQLALLSGQQGEPLGSNEASIPIFGSWIAHPVDNPELEQKIMLRVSDSNYIEHFEIDEEGTLWEPMAGTIGTPLSKRNKGTIQILDQSKYLSKPLNERTNNPVFEYAEYTVIKSISYKISGSLFKADIRLEGEEEISLLFYRHSNRNVSENS